MAISYQFVGISFFPILVALGVLWFRVEDAATHIQLLFVTVLSFIAFVGTFLLIPPVSELCLKADLFGKDINKGGTTKVYVLYICTHISCSQTDNNSVLKLKALL
jgi:uncharacterized membrane protein YozB (DUF420 family)